MTIKIDTDGDGKPDIIAPLKYVFVLAASLLTVMGAQGILGPL